MRPSWKNNLMPFQQSLCLSLSLLAAFVLSLHASIDLHFPPQIIDRSLAGNSETDDDKGMPTFVEVIHPGIVLATIAYIISQVACNSCGEH